MNYIKRISQFFFAMMILSIEYANGDASAVYNLRIAETTKRHRDTMKGPYSVSTLTAFNVYRNRFSGQREDYAGLMATFIHVMDPFYIRFDWAGANVRADNKITDFHFEKIQTDDFLILAGYSFEPHKKVKGTFSGLFGFPTHRDRGLFEPQFGIGEFGVGGQLSWQFDLSERLANHHPNCALRTAARFIHFFPRTNTRDGEKFRFSKGHMFDLIAVFRISYGEGEIEKHRVKWGYNPTFFFGVTVSPNFDDAVDHEQYIRNSFFMDYKFRFFIDKHPSSVALALSYGFDLKRAQSKRIIGLWGVGSVSY